MKETVQLLEDAGKYILNTAIRPDIVMERGEGMFLWDTEGKRYLDFIGGWAVTCLGHCPEAITESLKEQSVKLVNASPSFYNKPMIEFAKLLCDISCFDRVFFLNSGAEANESAIKLARKYGAKRLGGAYEVITTINSFHGRTLATMSATGKQVWKDLFAPKLPGFVHVPFNDIGAVSAAITPNTCAVMIEPVQGEGGVNPAEETYIRVLRKLCDDHNILLIFDEIQTGIGRLGSLFAYELYGVEPDIMTLAKGIGGGYPLSAMLTKEKYNLFEPGDQGGTYMGQPLGMAVGYAVVKEVAAKELPRYVKEKGEYIVKKLNEVKDRYGLLNIRGMGLLIGFDLPLEIGMDVVRECLAEGLVINSPQPSTIRLMPAYIVTNEDIDHMIDTLCRVMDRVLQEES